MELTSAEAIELKGRVSGQTVTGGMVIPYKEGDKVVIGIRDFPKPWTSLLDDNGILTGQITLQAVEGVHVNPHTLLLEPAIFEATEVPRGLRSIDQRLTLVAYSSTNYPVAHLTGDCESLGLRPTSGNGIDPYKEINVGEFTSIDFFRNNQPYTTADAAMSSPGAEQCMQAAAMQQMTDMLKMMLLESVGELPRLRMGVTGTNGENRFYAELDPYFDPAFELRQMLVYNAGTGIFTRLRSQPLDFPVANAYVLQVGKAIDFRSVYHNHGSYQFLTACSDRQWGRVWNTQGVVEGANGLTHSLTTGQVTRKGDGSETLVQTGVDLGQAWGNLASVRNWKIQTEILTGCFV